MHLRDLKFKLDEVTTCAMFSFFGVHPKSQSLAYVFMCMAFFQMGCRHLAEVPTLQKQDHHLVNAFIADLFDSVVTLKPIPGPELMEQGKWLMHKLWKTGLV